MTKDIQVKEEKQKTVLGCYILYRLFAFLGNKFYILSEKCVMFSKDKKRNEELDEDYKKKYEIGNIVVNNEKVCDDVLSIGEMDISCEETVEELGSTYLQIERELEGCRQVVMRLHKAHSDEDYQKMEEIFNSIGLYTKK